MAGMVGFVGSAPAWTGAVRAAGRRSVAAVRMSEEGQKVETPVKRQVYRSDPLARRGDGPKKVSRAASAQQGLGFQDAWTLKNGRKFDVWVLIGLLTILTPVGVLVYGLVSGLIPGLY